MLRRRVFTYWQTGMANSCWLWMSVGSLSSRWLVITSLMVMISVYHWTGGICSPAHSPSIFCVTWKICIVPDFIRTLLFKHLKQLYHLCTSRFFSTVAWRLLVFFTFCEAFDINYWCYYRYGNCFVLCHFSGMKGITLYPSKVLKNLFLFKPWFQLYLFLIKWQETQFRN
jgi:hypothetical protein